MHEDPVGCACLSLSLSLIDGKKKNTSLKAAKGNSGIYERGDPRAITGIAVFLASLSTSHQLFPAIHHTLKFTVPSANLLALGIWLSMF